MIEISHLTKIYQLSKRQRKQLKTKDSKKCAAKEVSLMAKPGEIYGLLGPNGAGKTTILRCVATLLCPTYGFIKVNGYDTMEQPEKVRESISFLTNEIKLDPQFSARYMFDFFSNLHGVSEQDCRERREKLFQYFGITPFQEKKIEELSTGMKQKAAIAVSLAHDPSIVIFDEPTSGLDIVTARSVTDYLRELKKEGKLVIISTHIMSEAEKLCDRIGIIIQGKKVMEGTLLEILSKTGTKELEDAFFSLYQKYNLEEDVR